MQTHRSLYRKTSLTAAALLRVSLIVLASVLIVSCQKGDAGPTGPVGPAGPTGATGTKGAANVIYSSWFTPAAYTKDTVFGIYGFSYTKATTDITQAVVDSGTVLTFGKLDGYNPVIWPSAQVSLLPISITYLDGSASNIDTWSAFVTAGNLKIRLVSSLNAYGGISNAHQFRYIIIPGGIKSTVASVKPIQQMSYSEICRRFGVPE
ncbi:MAG TPA: collagen-like protein [Puia sp.]